MCRFSRRFAVMMGSLLISASAGATGLSGLLDDYQKVTQTGRATTRLVIDNDSLLLNRNDGFYTSGLRILRQHALANAAQMTTFGWRIGQELYTASKIRLPASSVAALDHPYAGWLYGGFFRTVERVDGSGSTLGADVGCLGPCAGGNWTQTTLHRILGQPLPQGWSGQVRNEWGMVLYGQWAPVRWQATSWLDASPHIEGRFGNIHTDASAGLTIRAGQLPPWQGRAWQYGFLRTRIAAIGYDATLQGGYFSSGNSHTVQPKPWVAQAELGYAWRRGRYGLSASVVRRSNEIRGLPNARGNQNFARIIISYTP